MKCRWFSPQQCWVRLMLLCAVGQISMGCGRIKEENSDHCPTLLTSWPSTLWAMTIKLPKCLFYKEWESQIVLSFTWCSHDKTLCCESTWNSACIGLPHSTSQLCRWLSSISPLISSSAPRALVWFEYNLSTSGWEECWSLWNVPIKENHRNGNTFQRKK